MPDHDGLLFRRAVRDDVPPIVALLANDPLGATRESPTDPLPDAYHLAFDQIDRDPVQPAGGAVGQVHGAGGRDRHVVGQVALSVGWPAGRAQAAPTRRASIGVAARW